MWFFIFIVVLFIALVAIVYVTFWLVAKGLDQRYGKTDCNVKSPTPEELEAFKNRINERKKQRREEYFRKNKRGIDENLSVDIRSSGRNGTHDSQDISSDLQ